MDGCHSGNLPRLSSLLQLHHQLPCSKQRVPQQILLRKALSIPQAALQHALALRQVGGPVPCR